VLRSLRLLRETEERLEFVNELIRGHTYLSIPKPMRTALHGEVVTRLLAAEEKGRHVPGLEIAWHLIRAGRRDEATPYLLRGARESMRGGAPHEAERGLSTAMDRLQEPDRSEALLLLGEALQEQGRMEESMGFLNGVSDSARPAVLSRRNVLSLYAQHLTGEHTTEESREIALRLLEEAKVTGETNTRLRALWIAASFFRDLQEPELLNEVWIQLEREPSGDLSLEDKGEYALGRAFCLYYSGETARSLEMITGIIGHLESHEIKNSVYLTLLLGLCAIRGGMGEYEDAVLIGERGVQVAREIGDERRLRIFAANIALFHCRLGNADAQLSWAIRAGGDKWGITDKALDQKLHYVRAQAHAMREDVAQALFALELGTKAVREISQPWVRQMWELRAADVLALIGHNAEALTVARGAVTGDMLELRADSLAGPYARWSARVAISDGGSVVAVRARLEALLRRERHLDRMDQAEVLNAKVWLDKKAGMVDEEERLEMWRRLGDLPVGATNELKLLGMLDS
jgi:tetratricopeptide (TPR) repeat protein